MVSSGRTLLIKVLLRTLLMQVQLSSHVLTMEPEIDWSMKMALISESSLDTHIPADITFKLNEDGVEHKIGAHKMVLGMVSPVFNKLLIKMDALDKNTTELFVKGTTYGAFNIMKNAVYGMVPMSSSLKGKSVPEVFSIYDLVTRYQIDELRQVVQNHLASFPITDDTVLEVASDAKDHLLTFEEEAQSLLVRCAAHLKPKFKTVQSVLEYFSQNTENKEILHELLVLTKDNKAMERQLSIASAVAIECREEPCQNEVGFVPNRGHIDGGDKDGLGLREGRVYGGGRDGGGHNEGRVYGGGRDGGGLNRGRDGSGYGRGRDYDGYGGVGDYDGGDYDGYGGVGDDSEYGGGGYGRVGDNRDYGGDGRYGGVRNDGGYRGGGGYSRSRDNSEYSGGNGFGGSQDERGYRGGEYGGIYWGKGEYDKGRDGVGYREENVYGRGRDDDGDRGKGGYGGKYGGGRDDGYGRDIRGKDVRGYKRGGYGGSKDGGEYGGGRYNGGDRNGGGFKGGRSRDGGDFLRGDYGRNERGNY